MEFFKINPTQNPNPRRKLMGLSTHEQPVINQSNEATDILLKISELSTALETNNPDISSYVKAIHKNLLQFPELVHILQPSQVVTIVKGIELVNGEKIAEETKPKVRATRATKPKESIADLLDGLGI
jgi:hypothetical protein